jgi:hypothetical protein
VRPGRACGTERQHPNGKENAGGVDNEGGAIGRTGDRETVFLRAISPVTTVIQTAAGSSTGQLVPSAKGHE